MYKRDFGILFLAACAVFLSIQNEGPFTFKKAWFYNFEAEEVQNALPMSYTHLPQPVAADLNGDGKPEVLAASPGGALLVIAPRRPGDGFAPALELSRIDLAAVLNSSEPVAVMALAAGPNTPRPSDLVRAPRKQVVVAVTAAGDVAMFDHNLKLVWKQSLREHLPEGGRLDEAAVLITEYATSKGDRGLVVVGVRAEPDTLADDIEDDDFLDEELEAEGLGRAHAHGRAKVAKLLEVEGAGGTNGRHFSYFAFAGDSGVLRWKHEAQDFHRDLTSLQEATVATQHSLHAAAQLQEGVHYGEASCRDYREAVLGSLPHSWFAERDTRLHLAHFHRHRSHLGSQKEKLSTIGLQRPHPATQSPASAARGVFGALFGGSSSSRRSSSGNAAPAGTAPPNTGAAPATSRVPPNVVVAHLEEGIEAIHLFSGRTVCRLYLPAMALHVDLNGDGVPDHVHATGGDPSDLSEEAAEEDADPTHAHSRHRFCAAAVTSGIPAKQDLFNGTICRPMRFGLHRARHLGYVDVAPPVALPVPGKKGHYRHVALRQKSNAIFLTSRGDLTAYAPSGELLWQVSTGSFWKTPALGGEDAEGSDGEDGGAARYRHIDDVLDEFSGPEPTLVAVALRRHAVPSAVLAAGDEDATLVSENGRELASFSLPGRPMQPLVPVDFNLDGYTDVVMVGRNTIYGWAQVRRPGAVPFSALVGVLVVIMLTTFLTQEGFMQPQGGPAKGRSTDRVD